MRSFGVVKWFGGHNSKTDRENNFGFITDLSGKDIYLHKNEWVAESDPDENDVVMYIIKEDRGKWKASDAKPIAANDLSILEIDEALQSIRDSGAQFSEKHEIERLLIAALSDKFKAENTDELLRFFAGKNNKSEIWRLLYASNKWFRNIKILSDLHIIDPLSDVSWDLIPPSYFVEHEKDSVEYLVGLGAEKAKENAIASLSRLPIDIILFLVIKGVLSSEEELGSRHCELSKYIGSMILKGVTRYSEYIAQLVETEIKPLGGLRSNPILVKIIDLALFKKYLFEKSPKFSSLYQSSNYLQTRADIFILSNIFSLLLAGSNFNSAYEVFFGHLWEAISNKKIDLIKQSDQVLSIFPACATMTNNLSCEAVYWKKQDMFLCRGKKCLGPKVKPDLTKSYLDFTIYDWFSHYKIDYLNEGEPSSRDFPIKVAGYLNRVVEIYDVIHCRKCRSLMLPDLRYSRVEYTTIENGQFVKKDLAASYRLTVFKCPNHLCSEFDRGCYINHCVGFGCYDIIDTRDLRKQCDSGRYICKGCGSCCKEHAKSNPVGLCPECGSTLRLYENVGQLSNIYQKRFVKCSSRGCGFSIPEDKVSKKFYQPICGPTIKVNTDRNFDRK